MRTDNPNDYSGVHHRTRGWLDLPDVTTPDGRRIAFVWRESKSGKTLTVEPITPDAEFISEITDGLGRTIPRRVYSSQISAYAD